MDMGKGYDNMIGCATCSLSQHLMQKVLLPCFILVVSSCFNPHVYLIAELWTCINSIDTLMYPYALPILQSLYPFSSLCLSCNLSSSLRSLQKGHIFCRIVICGLEINSCLNCPVFLWHGKSLIDVVVYMLAKYESLIKKKPRYHQVSLG